MGSNDMVVGEDHMLGPSYQRYNWHAGRCGSIAFGSSPRRGKTLISNPHCLAEVSTCRKDSRDNLKENQEWNPYRRIDVKLLPLSGSFLRGNGIPHK